MNLPAVTTAAGGLPASLTEALRRNAAARAAATAAGPAEAAQPASFAGALDAALKNVSASQQQAGAMARAFQADPSSVSLEETMVAMQKSQIGFQSALHVRNRLVSAYSDIMNMQL